MIWKALLLSLGSLYSLNAAPKPMNVVLILADDLGYGEIGCYGQQKIKTPHIDQLASEGVKMTQAYSGAPVCAPARCTLLSGKHLGHADIRGNIQAGSRLAQFPEGQYPMRSETVTVAQKFQEAGYKTGAFGKWGLGPVGSTGEPKKMGFDEFYGNNCQVMAHSYYPPYLWHNDQKVVINDPPIPSRGKVPAENFNVETFVGKNYAPDLILKEALKFIDQHHEKPFFLYLPFLEPHVSMHPSKKSIDQYPVEWDDQPYKGQFSYIPQARPRAAYAAMISDLDRHVGAVMESLKKYKLDQNTLVIFTSDNGTTMPVSQQSRFNVGGVDSTFFNSCAGYRGYKGSLYEGGIRVPFIAKLPGNIKPGTESDYPIYFPDIFPTLADAAKLMIPDQLDGINIWPALLGQKMSPRTNPMVWIFPEYSGQAAVRWGDYKAVRMNLDKGPSSWEIFNIVQDPKETQNIAEAKPELKTQLKAILEAEWGENKIFPVDKVKGLSGL